MSQIDFDAIDQQILPDIQERNKILDDISHNISSIENRIAKLNPSFNFIYIFKKTVTNLESDDSGLCVSVEFDALIWGWDKKNKRKALLYGKLRGECGLGADTDTYKMFEINTFHKSDPNALLMRWVFVVNLGSEPWHVRIKLKDLLLPFYERFLKEYIDSLGNTEFPKVITIRAI